MAIREIVIFPDDRLRRPTKVVNLFDDKLKELVNDMFETMYDDDGIGLAAPQIGISKKIVVIDIRNRKGEEANGDDNQVSEGTEEQSCSTELSYYESNPFVLINPEIVEKRGEVDSNEGCLSLPQFYETIKRAEWVKVEAQDLEGKKFTIETDGLLAICLQHEIDHLNGRVFADYLSSIKREKVNSQMKKYKKHLAEEKAKQQA